MSPSCDVIQKGERQLTDQQGARCGRQIYPDRHDEKTVKDDATRLLEIARKDELFSPYVGMRSRFEVVIT